MNPVETGKLIAKLRRDAGYTQASLADALNVTDKAVSKWERGMSLPDAALLPQLGKLLDCDIEILISGLSGNTDHEWTGLLILDDGDTCSSSLVYDKPLIHYLLSYFLLAGITSVDIKADPKEYEYIRSLGLDQYGFNISFTRTVRANTMIVYGKTLLFGANLTRIFHSYMAAEDVNIIPVVDNIELPMAFAHHTVDINVIKSIAERRKITRGMVNIPVNTSEELKDASEFVRVYQKYHDLKIADLHEIAVKREIIDETV